MVYSAKLCGEKISKIKTHVNLTTRTLMRFALLRLRLSMLKATQLENGCHGCHRLERILTHLWSVLSACGGKKSVFICGIRGIRFAILPLWLNFKIRRHRRWGLKLLPFIFQCSMRVYLCLTLPDFIHFSAITKSFWRANGLTM